MQLIVRHGNSRPASAAPASKVASSADPKTLTCGSVNNKPTTTTTTRSHNIRPSTAIEGGTSRARTVNNSVRPSTALGTALRGPAGGQVRLRASEPSLSTLLEGCAVPVSLEREEHTASHKIDANTVRVAHRPVTAYRARSVAKNPRPITAVESGGSRSSPERAVRPFTAVGGGIRSTESQRLRDPGTIPEKAQPIVEPDPRGSSSEKAKCVKTQRPFTAVESGSRFGISAVKPQRPVTAVGDLGRSGCKNPATSARPGTGTISRISVKTNAPTSKSTRPTTAASRSSVSSITQPTTAQHTAPIIDRKPATLDFDLAVLKMTGTAPVPDPKGVSQFAELQQQLKQRSYDVALASASNHTVREHMERDRVCCAKNTERKLKQDSKDRQVALMVSQARAQGLPDPRYYPAQNRAATQVKRATSAPLRWIVCWRQCMTFVL